MGKCPILLCSLIKILSVNLKKSFLVILLVLVADQVLKIWVKSNLLIGEEINVLGNWFIIHFTENNGMAFGLQFGDKYGKLFLTFFRITSLLGIGWYLLNLIKQSATTYVITSLSLIFSGTLGNIIDSLFYGIIFSDSYYQPAVFMPEQGYAGLFHGKVVDMLYFPIIQFGLPSWFPIWPLEDVVFFRPVFNIADVAITFGVIQIILGGKHFFTKNV